MAFQKSSRKSHRQNLHNVESEAEEDVTTMADRSKNKERSNADMKMKSYFKPKVDEFVRSAPPMNLVVTLINFSVIEHIVHEGQFIPGEMALSAFRIRSGIIDNCVVYINHGKRIPKTATYSLNNLLNLPTFVETQSNYKHAIRILNLFRKKYRYGEETSQHALLFCRQSEFDKVSASLDCIFRDRGTNKFAYQLFPVEYLLSCLPFKITQKTYDEVTKVFGSYQEKLDSGHYKNFDQLTCPHHYHFTRCAEHCPLKTVNTLAYIIMAAFMDIEVASRGAHLPHRCDKEASRRRNQKPKKKKSKKTLRWKEKNAATKGIDPRPGNLESISVENPSPYVDEFPSPNLDAETWNNQEFYPPTQQSNIHGGNLSIAGLEFYQFSPQPLFPIQPYVDQWPSKGNYPSSEFPIYNPPVSAYVAFDINSSLGLNQPSQIGYNPTHSYSESSIQYHYQHNYPTIPFIPPRQCQNCSLMCGLQNQNSFLEDNYDATFVESNVLSNENMELYTTQDQSQPL